MRGKKTLVLILLVLLVSVGYGMRLCKNIIVFNEHINITDDEYAVRYRATIKVIGLTKKDFEFVAKEVFESRRDLIRKYKLELNSDGHHPRYKLTMVEAKSIDDVNDALDEIDSYDKQKTHDKKLIQNKNVAIESIDCSYDVESTRAQEFELTLKELADARDIEVLMRGRPYKEKTFYGVEKTYFNFTLTGEPSYIEEVLMELDRIFEDPYEDRD